VTRRQGLLPYLDRPNSNYCAQCGRLPSSRRSLLRCLVEERYTEVKNGPLKIRGIQVFICSRCLPWVVTNPTIDGVYDMSGEYPVRVKKEGQG